MGTRANGITRRDTLRIAALLGFCSAFPYAARAIGPGLPRRGDRPSIFQAEYPLADPARMVMSTCAGCRGGCPVRAHREVGIVAKVDGNPWSPRQHGDPVPKDLSHAATLRGASCARGQARVQNVHDPYRIVRALVRDGPRGEGRFRTVDADDALHALLDGVQGQPGLGMLRRASMGQDHTDGMGRFLIAVDPRHQDRRIALETFTAAFAGSAALLGHPAPGMAAATERLLGAGGWIAAPRWDRARALVAWGANPIAGGLDPVGTAWWMAEKRSQAIPIVAVDPWLSDVAGMADDWLPVRPGGDRALAHWIARIWVEEGWVPPAAIPAAVRERPTRQLEHASGLGPRIVHKLAGTLFEAGPGLAVTIGGGVTDHAGGAATAEAILHLAAVAGALGPGGAMEPVADPIPPTDGPAELLEALTGPHPPEVLLLVGDGGVQDTPFERAVVAALTEPERIPVVIALTTAMNRIAWFADHIFPDVTEFERIGLESRHDGSSVVLPLIEPIPVQAGAEGPAARGLEGFLQGLLDAEEIQSDVTSATWAGIASAARAADLPHLDEQDGQILDEALNHGLPEDQSANPVLRSFLARGWAPPAPSGAAPRPVPWRDGASVVAAPSHPVAPVLVTYRESFGGQVDSDAQAWGARSIRRDNPLQIHPERLESLHGSHSDQMRVGDAVARFRATEGIRPDTVALAVGYGQHHGFDGKMVVDGVSVPPAKQRCAGVAVGPLLTPERTVEIATAEKLRDPSLWDLLKPGGKELLPSAKRKHHEDL